MSRYFCNYFYLVRKLGSVLLFIITCLRAPNHILGKRLVLYEWSYKLVPSTSFSQPGGWETWRSHNPGAAGTGPQGPALVRMILILIGANVNAG